MKINGNIFRNKFKDSDNKPDFKGTVKDENGTELDCAIWMKKDKNGNVYPSINIQDKFIKRDNGFGNNTPNPEYNNPATDFGNFSGPQY